MVPSEEQIRIAKDHHPAWHNCSLGARKLLIRNVPIILGEFLNEPSECVVTWLPEDDYQGGTRHALNIAESYGVRIFDIRKESDQAAFLKFIWN